MDELEIEIFNWDKYNPKEFKVKYKHWFRLNREILFSESLFNLTPEQKWLWVCLLAIACKKGECSFKIDRKWLAHHSGLTEKAIDLALKCLVDGNLMGMNWEFDGKTLPPTEQDITEQNKTSSKMDFEPLYKLYPKKSGKRDGLAECVKQIKTPEDYELLRLAITRYAEYISRPSTDKHFIPAPKDFSTFMRYGRWRDCLDTDYGAVNLGSQARMEKGDV